jgi:NADP-dependent 3-hydroxy acid dehydrogenase YdfG
MPRQLQGMVCAITGASSGIGAALARELARAGARLVLAARRLDLLERLNVQMGGAHLVVPTDVADEAQCRRLIDQAVEHFGRIDTLVANAGYGSDKKTVDMSPAEVAGMLAVNVQGTIDCIRPAVAAMRRQEPREGWRGQIMITSSVLARRGVPYAGIYSATKAAQLSLAETLRLELAPERIAVTSVHPTATESEFGQVARRRGNSEIRGHSASVGKQSAEHVARRMARAIERPAREVWPARHMRYLMGLNAWLPALGDVLVARAIRRRERGA